MKKTFSTFTIAEMLNVDPGSVANWIDHKMLKAYRTPGGHRRVSKLDLVQFLRDHEMPVPVELDTQPVRILIVDDESEVTKKIAGAIKQAHPEYEVYEAHDGFRAGSLVAKVKPDLVLLDLRMPGMDGYEVCRFIKTQEDTRHIEILAMTAYPSDQGDESIRSLGARKCLVKPLQIDALIKEIEAVLVS